MDFTRRNVLLGIGLATSGALASMPEPASASISPSKTFSSVADLQAAIDIANSGDVLTLVAGTYSDAQITIPTNSLTIRSAIPGKAIFTGSSHVVIKASNTIFGGFQFLNGDYSGIVIRVFGSDNYLQDLNFFGYSAQKYINLEAGGQRNEISYCNFENKPISAPQGNLVGVLPHPTIPGFHRIRFCSFKNILGNGGDNGNEPIRIGLGALSAFASRTIVEYCYWENTGLGDSENISVKSRENVIRYCTFQNNKEGMLVFRNGDDNMAYGNSFINAGGIRVKEASNIFCFNNYFENSGVGGGASSVYLEYLPGNLRNINFLFNTFHNCASIDLGGIGPTLNHWSNNLFVKTSGPIFMAPNRGTQWLGNIYQGSLGLPATVGLKFGAPKFAHKANDYYRPIVTSINRLASVAGYAKPVMYEGLIPVSPLSQDLLRSLRPLKTNQWDVGAIQFTKNPANIGWLSSKTTGPRYT